LDWIARANLTILETGLTYRIQLLSTPNKHTRVNGVETLFPIRSKEQIITRWRIGSLQDDSDGIGDEIGSKGNYSELVIGNALIRRSPLFPPASVELKGLKNGVWKTIVRRYPEQSKSLILP